MPYSEKQRMAAAVAKHNPGKLYARNRGFLKMSDAQLSDYASGPVKKPAKKKRARWYGDED